MRVPGETYHTSDVAGGTDLHVYNSSQVGSTRMLRHSYTMYVKFYKAPSFFFHAMLKSREEPGYVANRWMKYDVHVHHAPSSPTLFTAYI